MLFEIKNASVSLNGNEIIKNSDFRICDNEKIGIVGRNGAGKTTLLKLITSEINLDYNEDGSIGEIIRSKDFNCGYLSQIVFENTDNTVYEELKKCFSESLEIKRKIDELIIELSKEYTEKNAILLNEYIDKFKNKGGETFEKEIKIGFKKFGFDIERLNNKLSEFSGGEMTKISLLKLILSNPKVLILDEPTNHLDIEAIEWLEEYLKKYNKNTVLVSHDRMFLNNICNIIYEIEHKTITKYSGNYDYYINKKNLNYETKLKEYNKNEKEIKRLTELTDRFRYKATKAKMVKSKEKMIERLKETTFNPIEEDKKRFNTKVNFLNSSAKEVLKVNDLIVGYEKALNKINIIVNRKDRLAIVGRNGTGKSTFLKTIMSEIKPLGGDFYFGNNVIYEYFDQKLINTDSDKTLFDDFSIDFPSYSNTDIRNILGKFMFHDDDVFKKINSLSGGEKVRFVFAKIFEKNPNLMILDEPTNHLDILGKESLEEIIKNYDGTLIFVSHDRYFVKKLATKVLLFKDNNTMNFETYEDYMKYLDTEKGEIENDKTNYEYIRTSINDDSLKETDKLLEYKNDKKSAKESFIQGKEKSKIEKKIKNIEDKIEKTENEIKILNDKLNDDTIASNYDKLNVIQNDIDEKKHILNDLMEEWEDLNWNRS